MQVVQDIDIHEKNREEILPGFSEEFPYIATCAELDKYPDPYVPWHWHRTVELFWLKSGTLEYTTPGQKWTIRAGDGGFLNTNVLHASRVLPSGDSTIQLLHLFDPVLLSGGHGSRMEEKYILPVTVSGVEFLPLRHEIPEEAGILEKMKEAFSFSGAERGYEFRLRTALSEIWLGLLELMQESAVHGGKSRKRDDKIKMLMIYIHEHYSEPISVDDMAAVVHVSRRVCFRLFQESLHMTPVEYMRAFRLQKACQLLAGSRLSITEIGYACGLGSGSYFGKAFRQMYGCTPAQFRKKWHNRDNNGQEPDIHRLESVVSYP